MVVAIEHRDGSGPRTFINLPPDKIGVDTAKGKEDAGNKDRKKGYSRMDYVFPKGNERDTMPGNEQGVDAELRSAQIQLRLAEIEEAYYVMTQIQDGEGEDVAERSLRCKRKGNIGGSSRGLIGVNWEEWKNRFHLLEVTMLGQYVSENYLWKSYDQH